jgi:hypothetical protein
MDSPTFSDRDAALRQMMGPPTAQQHLHSSMGYPRWDLMPVAPVEPVKPRSFGWMIWPALVLGLAACVVIGSI